MRFSIAGNVSAWEGEENDPLPNYTTRKESFSGGSRLELFLALSRRGHQVSSPDPVRLVQVVGWAPTIFSPCYFGAAGLVTLPEPQLHRLG